MDIKMEFGGLIVCRACGEDLVQIIIALFGNEWGGGVLYSGCTPSIEPIGAFNFHLIAVVKS